MENLKHRKNNSAPQKTTAEIDTEQNKELIRAVDKNQFNSVVNVIRNRLLNICAETAQKTSNEEDTICKRAIKCLKKSEMLLFRWTKNLLCGKKAKQNLATNWITIKSEVLPLRSSNRIILGFWGSTSVDCWTLQKYPEKQMQKNMDVEIMQKEC